MSCFNNRNTENIQPVLPPEFDYKKLFPKYKIAKTDHTTRHQLKGTRIIISDRILENEYYNYSCKYPWIKIKCFEITQPKEKYICIKIINNNSKNPQKIIVFSNGESSNICGILPILVDLSSYLKVNIMTYEYPKTNLSQGINKKEQDMLESALTIASYVYASVEFKSFILMGYSIGAYLNYKVVELLVGKSKKFVNKLKNIISISPMWCFDSSYAKKIYHNRKYSNFISNLIKNTNLKLKVSSFVSHGVKDNKIGYMISMNICSRLNFIYEWYPKEGDHYNLLLKTTYRRKLLKRLEKFLSVEDISIGNEFDNSIISRLTTQGIKVNITKDYKDLNVSSGNFCFKNKEEKDTSNTEARVMSSKGLMKIKTNKTMGRKESGFSFLDISIQKHLNTNDIENNINEINDEEDYDKDDDNDENINNKNLDIINDEDEDNEKNSLNINNIININNDNYNKENKIYDNNDEYDDKIIEVVSSVVTKNDGIINNNNENDIKKKESKGFLINDSFGYIEPENKENEELSFRKDGNN